RVAYACDIKLSHALETHGQYIKNETLAIELLPAADSVGGFREEHDINGARCTIGIERINR
ncbi:MAG TPA: hypothetical protein VKS81_02855, partial [Bacteroidota bacterium]|nr:hypothetical protein [Bacteroidota bacterium]